MKTIQTSAIILSRTDYGEADRIVRILTPNYGKISLMARGARKPRSKLAGAIELFSISELTISEGKSEIKTLISGRLTNHFTNIVKDIDRVQCGYDFIKILNRNTEDLPESDYYYLLSTTLESLDDELDIELIKVIFNARLLSLSGHAPNLITNSEGKKLDRDDSFEFDYDKTCFRVASKGNYSPLEIKFMRLLFADASAKQLSDIKNQKELTKKVAPLVYNLSKQYLHNR